MGMGRRKEERQEDLFIAANRLESPGHVFYDRLNQLLADADFDRWIESRCEQFYSRGDRPGRPSIPPGVFFRMLFVGYFEGIDSQRGIAWRCADSLSLRQFLGLTLSEPSPDHSSLTNTRKRLPEEVCIEIFQFVLRIAVEKKLLSGKTVAVDSTTLEANAAMKSIVRKDTGEDWKAYVTRLMVEEGAIKPGEQPTDEDVRRFDKKRKDKKVPNDKWVSKTDPASRIAKMKDGRTHMAYKAEHVVDLESDLIVAAEIRPADEGDSQTLVDSVLKAQENLDHADAGVEIEEVVADKGYHAAATLELCDSLGMRTYIPERKRSKKGSGRKDKKRKGPRRSRKNRPRRANVSAMTVSRIRADHDDMAVSRRRAVELNRRRLRRDKSKRLQRLRSERCERTFAHVCETGGARRTWLRGLAKTSARYWIVAAAHNLGRILRKLFGIGKPRVLQGAAGLAALAQLLVTLLIRPLAALKSLLRLHRPPRRRLFQSPLPTAASF